MAIKFYDLKVRNIKKETADAVSVTFDIPEDLKETFDYKHGQYVTVRVPVNSDDNRRAYSISSSPIFDKRITITVKKVDDGIVSKYLNETLKIGDILKVMPPLGNFTIELNQNNQKTYFLIGGGSGITPLMSILKSVLSVEPLSRIFLLYQNRYEETIIFADELKQLSSEYSDRFTLVNCLSIPTENWQGAKGRIDKEFISGYLRDNLKDDVFKAEFFLCGPDGLMTEAELALKDTKVASYQIHKEVFTVALDNTEKVQDNIILQSSDSDIVTRKVKIILYSEELEFEVSPDDTVLTAALSEGHDPPFSCQIGACSTCRAKLISGKVFMDERDSLTDDEIEEGYVLTCQAHPLTDDVVIDYD